MFFCPFFASIMMISLNLSVQNNFCRSFRKLQWS